MPYVVRNIDAEDVKLKTGESVSDALNRHDTSIEQSKSDVVELKNTISETEFQLVAIIQHVDNRVDGLIKTLKILLIILWSVVIFNSLLYAVGGMYKNEQIKELETRIEQLEEASNE